jgi:transcription antitermination protein NusB
MQAVYQWLLAGGEVQSLRDEFLAERAPAGIDVGYFGELLETCMTDRAALDRLLEPGLDRPLIEVDPVERSILLIGAVELRDRPELAVAVVINEAVELAKDFGADNGHRFVNAALDHLARRLRSETRSAGGDDG